MSYQKQTFTGGMIFTAAMLAAIENGVAANDAKATALAARANALAETLDDLTGWTQYSATKAGRSFVTGLSLQNGETLRIRNVTITGANNEPYESMKVWGYASADPSVDTHTQISYKTASQLSGEISVTAGADYPRVAIIVESSSTTYTTAFEYKVTAAGAVAEASSAAGTYTTHSFTDGNDLYPDELEDMEDQIAADEAALAALETRLDTAAAAAGELLPWKSFTESFTGSKAFGCTMLAGQTLMIRNLSITLASGEPTTFKVHGSNQSTYDASELTLIAAKTSFSDFAVTIPGNFTYLRVNAEPSSVQQTVSFEYKVV